MTPNDQQQTIKTIRYLIQTVDPVHVGTGGMRLGRVDNTIVREPGTKLPKIPGTSLSGAIRSYAAHRYASEMNADRICAGQSKGENKHCGKPECPICYTFGTLEGERPMAGIASFGDARIAFFPVYSMIGPVWVTSPTALHDCLGVDQNNYQTQQDRIRVGDDLKGETPINLGWLMLQIDDTRPDLSLSLPAGNDLETIGSRLVLVSDKIFSQIVNSNLEVRTSVSINPETGAAEEGALFTYEAIPRATFLWFDLIVDDYRGKASHWETGSLDWTKVEDVVEAGLKWAHQLGIGGMGTRGFGRIMEIAHGSVANSNSIDWAHEQGG